MLTLHGLSSDISPTMHALANPQSAAPADKPGVTATAPRSLITGLHARQQGRPSVMAFAHDLPFLTLVAFVVATCISLGSESFLFP
jgi:hypothetical protein